jgi:UPF0176 protein
VAIRSVEKNIINLSGYLFTPIRAPLELQPLIKEAGIAREVKGTVLLSEEGINCFVAGTEESLKSFEEFLFTQTGIPSFELKKSYSDYQPFSRFLVKVKKEIISTGREDLLPHKEQAPYIEAKELKKLYDQKADFIVLDTRNDYEIELGKFKDAKDLGVSTFRKFIAKIDSIPQEWKNKTVVTYCTGGIRCEKAALLLKNMGFDKVQQLKGGILKYFEECGNEHYEGECFVFDKRIGVDASLIETDAIQCFACRAPLQPADTASPYYIYEKSCPKCKKEKREE